MANNFTLLILILLSSCLFEALVSKEHCTSPSCNPSRDSFPVHYPFRLPQFQPDIRCSYGSGFTLSCSPSNQTLVELPAMGSFPIQTINYVDQLLNITDPKDCFPKLLFDGFDLGGSAFTLSFYLEYYTYYNCTLSGASRFYPVSCMSGETYKVVALQSDGEVTLPNCTRIKTVFAPRQPFESLDTLNSVNLYWYEPSNCEVCTAMGEACELIIGGSFVCRKKGHGLSDGAKVGIALGVSIPFLLLVIILVRKCGEKPKLTQVPQQPLAETELSQTSVVVAQEGQETVQKN